MLSVSLTAHNSDDLCSKNTGLGNVLYQLSFQYSMSKQNNIIQNYDYIDYFSNKLIEYNLPNYKETIFRFFKSQIMLPLDENKRLNQISLSEDRDIGFCIYNKSLIDKIIENKHNHIIIKNSYLQSIKYFDFYRDEIQELFAVDDISLKYILNKYTSIKTSSEYVNTSIHLRFLWGGNVNFVNHEFIDSAIKYLKSKNRESKLMFFVFSDDITCAKSFLSVFKDEIFIYCEDNHDYIDLWIMTLCINNIINHSTLGWWGAYLNKNEQKIVIYPDRIIKDFYITRFNLRSSYHEIKENLYPSQWVGL